MNKRAIFDKETLSIGNFKGSFSTLRCANHLCHIFFCKRRWSQYSMRYIVWHHANIGQSESGRQWLSEWTDVRKRRERFQKERKQILPLNFSGNLSLLRQCRLLSRNRSPKMGHPTQSTSISPSPFLQRRREGNVIKSKKFIRKTKADEELRRYGQEEKRGNQPINTAANSKMTQASFCRNL